jgi:hypothetical protein
MRYWRWSAAAGDLHGPKSNGLDAVILSGQGTNPRIMWLDC